MPADSNMPPLNTVHRTVHLRLLPETQAQLGLHRSILVRGWRQREQCLVCQCSRWVKGPAAYTRQTDRRCGSMAQAHGPRDPDWNAAWHIVGRCDLPVPHEAGAAARRETLPWGTPMTREQDMPEAVYSL